MSKRCQDCGQLLQLPVPKEPRPWFWIDGTAARICAACLRETVVLAGHREDLRSQLARRLGW